MRLLIAAAVVAMLAGCSHNSSLLMMGTKASIGVDPQTYTLNAQYTDGLSLGDVSRENSEWELAIDTDAGVSYDTKTGTLNGVKHIKRKLGPQISGYLVDLAKQDPESAREYLKATAEYWKAEKAKAEAEKAKAVATGK